jgi:ABC-type polysaccharide/polyol phosphate transport system ATPase subunit
VTHDVPFAQNLCSRAVFFQAGKIAAEGSVEEIAGRFGWDFALGGCKSR